MATETKAAPIKARLAALDWQDIYRRMDEHGFAVTPPLLTPMECQQLIGLYSDDKRFRSRIDMARFRFGEGEYKYFAYPLPDPVRHSAVRPIRSSLGLPMVGQRGSALARTIPAIWRVFLKSATNTDSESQPH